MIPYDNKEVLISLHIPKCGGTSFECILKQWFCFGFHGHYMNHFKIKKPKKASINLILKNYFPVCIHGHFDKENDGIGVFDYYPGSSQFITIYREPLEIQLSYYFYTKKLFSTGSLYWKGEKMNPDSYLGKDIDEHLEKRQDYHWLNRFIPFKIEEGNYKEVIEKKFIHIGIAEELQKSVDIFAEKLNKKNIRVPIENTSKRSEKPSESSIKKFKEMHRLEYNFFDYACKLNNL